jgi:MinD superfamily P-loop ATPase
MTISVASGKGGTGKTTIATSLALSLDGAQMLDCDVEEPNSHLFIKAKMDAQQDVTIPVPEIDEDLCDGCGRCREVCRYNAIAVLNKEVLVFQELCHGCGACEYLCPQTAIREQKRVVGVVETGFRDTLQFVQGKLCIGTPMPTPVIKAVKRFVEPDKITVIDAPPGTSCPVIESIKGSDYCILVTEPTPFGLHDLTLAVGVLKKMEIPFGVIINRSDLGDDNTEIYCRKNDIPVHMCIPFDRRFASAYARGLPLVEFYPRYGEQFRALLHSVMKRAGSVGVHRVAT